MFPISYLSSMEFSTLGALKILSNCRLLVYPISTYSIPLFSNGSPSSRQEVSHNALIFRFFLKISSNARRNFCSICTLHISVLPVNWATHAQRVGMERKTFSLSYFPPSGASLFLCINITQRGQLCNLIEAKGSRDGIY